MHGFPKVPRHQGSRVVMSIYVYAVSACGNEFTRTHGVTRVVWVTRGLRCFLWPTVKKIVTSKGKT